MWYDTRVIYGDSPDTHFAWDGETFYRTPKGKPKKINKNNVRVYIEEQELQLALSKYNDIFNKNLSI